MRDSMICIIRVFASFFHYIRNFIKYVLRLSGFCNIHIQHVFT